MWLAGLRALVAVALLAPLAVAHRVVVVLVAATPFLPDPSAFGNRSRNVAVASASGRSK